MDTVFVPLVPMLNDLSSLTWSNSRTKGSRTPQSKQPRLALYQRMAWVLRLSQAGTYVRRYSRIYSLLFRPISCIIP